VAEQSVAAGYSRLVIATGATLTTFTITALSGPHAAEVAVLAKRSRWLNLTNAEGTLSDFGSFCTQGTYDKNKARIAYQGFLTVWKDADPNIPILKESKAEYEN
jgi:hypothetical protein